MEINDDNFSLNAELLSLAQIMPGDNAEKYNAFTSLTSYKGFFWVAFRTGKNHVSPHGKIQVLNSKNGVDWNFVSQISKEELDLRDPRLAVINNELYIMAFALYYFKAEEKTPNFRKKFVPRDTYFFKLNNTLFEDIFDESKNREEDKKQSNNQLFQEIGRFDYKKYPYILWDLKQHNNKGDKSIYATGYNYAEGFSRLALFKISNDNWLNAASNKELEWELVSEIPQHMLSSRNGLTESDMVFINENGRDKMVLFCRVDKNSVRRPRELDNLYVKNTLEIKLFNSNGFDFRENKLPGEINKNANGSKADSKDSDGFRKNDDVFMVAEAYYPYDKWSIKVYPIYLKGPRAIALDSQSSDPRYYLVVGRTILSRKQRKRLRELTFKSFHKGDDESDPNYNGNEKISKIKILLKKINFLWRDVVLFLYDKNARSHKKAFSPLILLASGRDGSYAQILPFQEKKYLISFYSDHARVFSKDFGRANDIWLAEIEMDFKRK
ncbi:MAG: hypothetical protein ACTSU2_10900 [Promethearchaeota archaeon]